MIIWNILIALLYLFINYPVKYIVGKETREEFLQHNVPMYPALQLGLKNLQSNEFIFGMWEGRTYHCNGSCIPDSYNYSWTNLVLDLKSTEEIATYLREKNVRYLLLNKNGLDYFMLMRHDPEGHQLSASSFFFHEFMPQCANEIYRDKIMRLYEFTCR